MPGRNQQSPPTPRGDWLRRDEGRRARPWALAQQLFDETPDKVEPERPTLVELEQQLHDQARRIAELESKLALLPAGESDGSAGQSNAPRRTVALRRQIGPDREFWLAHCEGFLVDSPEGPVGVVETVRFGSRLDLPDEIEIRAGRIRPIEFVVPIEEIVEVDPEAELIRLAYGPRVTRHPWAHTLLPRARRRLDSFVSTTFR